jgi:Flp pilus assembly protein CpaB
MEPIDIRKRLRSRQGASGALPPLAEPPAAAPPPQAPTAPAAPAAPAYAPPRYQSSEPAAAEPAPGYTPPRYNAPEPPPAAAQPAGKAGKGGKLKGEVNKRMLILALGCAAVASLLIVNYVRSSAGILAQQSRLIKVATVVKDIPARTVVTKDMITVSEIPALFVPKDMATPETEIVGKVALTALFAGEQIHTKRLSEPNAETGLAVKIPNGHRAMAMQNRLAGLVKPGDYVDVFAIVNDKGGKPLTLPVLQRILVLAVGAKVSVNDTTTNPNTGFDSNANSATLAVPETKVDLLTLLEEKGNFKLVLRAPEDTSTVPVKYKDKQLIDMILGAEPPVVKPKPAAPKPAAVHHAPAYRPAAPARTYTPPARPRAVAPKPAAPAPNRGVTVTVINGGNVQQQSQ